VKNQSEEKALNWQCGISKPLKFYIQLTRLCFFVVVLVRFSNETLARSSEGVCCFDENSRLSLAISEGQDTILLVGKVRYTV